MGAGGRRRRAGFYSEIRREVPTAAPVGLRMLGRADSLPRVRSNSIPSSKQPGRTIMIRSLTLISSLALAATAGTLFAQQPPAGQQPPARGVESALALEAVQA